MYYLLAGILFISCSEDQDSLLIGDPAPDFNKVNRNKIQICHHTDSGYVIMDVSQAEAEKHYLHGDVNPDKDGDGYTAYQGEQNPCGLGSANDCNDNYQEANPGATEICGDMFDNNCNGHYAMEIVHEIADPSCPCLDTRGMCMPLNLLGKCPEKYKQNTIFIIKCEDVTAMPGDM